MKLVKTIKLNIESAKAGFAIGMSGNDLSKFLDDTMYLTANKGDKFVLNVVETLCIAKGFHSDAPAIFVMACGQSFLYICNKAFAKLSLEVVLAMLEHEKGHIILGHVSSNPKVQLGNMFRNMIRPWRESSIEYEADMYAVEAIGKEAYIDALTRLRDIYKDIDFPYSGLNKRIEFLKGE